MTDDERAHEMARALLALRDDPDSRTRGLELAFTDLLEVATDRTLRIHHPPTPDPDGGTWEAYINPDFITIIRVLVRTFFIHPDEINAVAWEFERENEAAVDDGDEDEGDVST